MDKLEFDLIYKDVLAKSELALVNKLRLYIKDVLYNAHNPEEKILFKDVAESVYDFMIYGLRESLAESVKASTLLLEKYHHSQGH